jgi:DNA-directed RNA polymerase specialized sigma24 family protein
MSPHSADTASMARLVAALQQMPVRQRAIFLAVSNDEQSYAELAGRFGISSAQVEQELARALVLLDEAADGRPITWRTLLLRWVRRHRRD